MNEGYKQRPWHARAAELEAKEGFFSDYMAWIEWLHERQNEQAAPAAPINEVLDFNQSASLYLIFCDLFDEMMLDVPVIVQNPTGNVSS